MAHHQAVFKAVQEAQHLVFAEVYAPNRLDSDGEFMTAETIRKMAYKFMKEQKLDQIDQQHDNVITEGIHIVESFIARKDDPDFIEDAWVVGVYIPDEATWDKVIKGEINGFSVEAMVTKEPVEIEMEIPPVISGMTMKSEDHEHTFHVAYDETGRFLGGTTDEVANHFHVIKRGTCTEEAVGHSHRFSHVEEVVIKG